MVRFLVHLRDNGEEHSVRTNGFRRPSPEELRRHHEAIRQWVVKCIEKIRELLPPPVQVYPLETLGHIIVAVPSGDQVRDAQERILASCGDVVAGFSCDSEIELLQAPKR